MQNDKTAVDGGGSVENIDPAISSLSHAIVGQSQLAPVAPMAPVDTNHGFPRDGLSQDLARHSEIDGGSRCMPNDGGDTPKRTGKRELSTSKRAAQNRAAQVLTPYPFLNGD